MPPAIMATAMIATTGRFNRARSVDTARWYRGAPVFEGSAGELGTDRTASSRSPCAVRRPVPQAHHELQSLVHVGDGRRLVVDESGSEPRATGPRRSQGRSEPAKPSSATRPRDGRRAAWPRPGERSLARGRRAGPRTAGRRRGASRAGEHGGPRRERLQQVLETLRCADEHDASAVADPELPPKRCS